ncbi:DNA-binding pseudobarrel domain containing protein [Parasponia andersonii]|uniref:DNA-binding pseudobarrel domain containing protein n=1 Tax=Parasponia andersonii TaxID=3476 RepID=A0A2P5CHB7_PARAD|nr:DNA-binding pseudobarrel domain containing protein [Parasponia andersonii]
MLVPRNLSFTESKRLVMSKETEKAVGAATASKLGNPSFMLILQPYITKYNSVHVPAEFARRHNLYRARISQGWGPFAARKNLKKGDVCVFELISKLKEILLKVWIHRAADYAAEPIPKRIKTE